MTWTSDLRKCESVNEQGYRVTWASNKHGTWYNAYAPSGVHIEAGYDRAKVEKQCAKHYAEILRKRAMYAAKKAAVPVNCDTEVPHETSSQQ